MNDKLRLIVLLILVTAFIGSVDTNIEKITAVPGEKFTIPLTIKNDKDYEREIALRATCEPLICKFYYNGKWVESLSLPANESVEVDLNVEIPTEIEEKTYNLFIYAGGSLSIRVNIAIPENPLTITPSISGIAVEAGDKVEIPITVKNNLNANYVVNLSAVLPEGWSYKFKENDMEIFKINLKPEESRTIHLEIETNSSTDIGIYYVRSKFNKQSITLDFKITETHKGEPGKLKLKVYGKNGQPLNSAIVNISGETYQTSETGEVIIEIPEGIYTLEISKDGYYGKEVENVEVKAGKTKDLGTIVLEQKPYGVGIRVYNPKISATIGAENPLYRIRIENTGYSEDFYELTVEELPENFYYKFREGAESISEVYLEGGEKKDIYLEILVPPNAKTGKYNFTVIVAGHETKMKKLQLSLIGEYRLIFNPLRSYMVNAEQGSNIEYDAFLRNDGSGSITNINFSVTPPSKWDVDVDPPFIPVIESYKTKQIKMRIHVPSDQVPGEYKIKLTIKSDQTSVDEEIRIIVREKSSASIVGGAVIIVAIVSLVLIFKKFGRR